VTAVAVLGGGAWGTVLADLLARKGIVVRLWAYEADVARSINDRHENVTYLPGAALHASLHASNDLSAVVGDAALICSVVPSHVSRQVLGSIAPHVAPGTRLVCATKGIDTETLQLMGEVVADALPQATFVALSGPSFAEEVARGLPTAVTVAATDALVAEDVALCLRGETFRAYVSDDLTGVEVGGAVKNVLAIAAGASDGLGFGDNARAAIITRGLAETGRLSAALGGKRETLMGLAGLGDLVLTCTGDLSRNRRVGLALAKAQPLSAILGELGHVAEGVAAARDVRALCGALGVDMPICDAVYRVLYENLPPRRAVEALLAREPGPEFQ